MNTEIFDTAFFGYSNLPDSIEFENRKLIPIKTLKGSAMFIRQICKIVGIQVYRPVKGLYCIEESDCRFFDYLCELNCSFWYKKDFIDQYNSFMNS